MDVAPPKADKLRQAGELTECVIDRGVMQGPGNAQATLQSVWRHKAVGLSHALAKAAPHHNWNRKKNVENGKKFAIVNSPPDNSTTAS